MSTTQTPNPTMSTSEAAAYLAFPSANAFRKRIRRGLVPPEYIHREGSRYRFDPAELDTLCVRLSELPRDEVAKIRPCDLRFKRSEIDAWMLSIRLEFQSKVHQVLPAIRAMLPDDWPDAKVAAVAAMSVGTLMGLVDEDGLPNFLFEE